MITPKEKYDAENAKLDVVVVMPFGILHVEVYLLLTRDVVLRDACSMD